MAYIGQGIKQGTFKVLDTSGNTYNGSNTTFSLGTQVGAAAQLLVSHDGVIQLPGTDYTLASGGTSITFSTAPASGASIFIVEISGAVGGTVTPSDNSVGVTQLNLSDGSNGQFIKTDGSGTLSFASVSSALDDISTGDAAVTLATSAGNITIDAQGNDTDIIFKGTDGSSDTTFLTLDGSDAGAATLNNGLTLSDGNLIVASGHGIDFSATGDGSSASNVAELFDDYEEGTFTPGFASTSGSFTTVSLAQGFYTKIGRMVHVQCRFEVSNIGNASANINVTGMPFTSASTGVVHTMMTSARETEVLGQNDEIIMSRDVTQLVILGAHFGNNMGYSLNFIYRAET
jgi:hypothetical protein